MHLVKIELDKSTFESFPVLKLTFEYDVPTYPGGNWPGRIVPLTLTVYEPVGNPYRKWVVGRFYDLNDVTEE